MAANGLPIPPPNGLPGIEPGTVSPASETIKAITGTAQGSTATASSPTYIFDYWTVDDGTE